MIIFSKDIESHLKDVDEVLRLLHQAGVTLKLKRCYWFTKKVDYLGHDITPGKLAVAKAPTDSFATATFPTNITELCSFLGATNVYRRFIRNNAHDSNPLTAMLCKEADASVKPEVGAASTEWMPVAVRHPDGHPLFQKKWMRRPLFQANM